MEECVEILSQSQESPYDEAFAHQVRLQHAASDIEDIQEASTVPLPFSIAAFNQNIADAKAKVPSYLLQYGNN